MDGQNQNSDDTSAHNPLSPDEPVLLREPAVSPATVSPVTQYVVPSPNPVPPPQPLQPAQSTVAAPTPPPSPFVDMLDDDEVPAAADPGQLTWTAPEFISHPKTSEWYLAFVGISIVILIVAYLVNRDVSTIFVVIICSALFGYTASRQPRQLEYSASASGITIGPKAYPYKDFSAFSIIDEGPFSSVNFMPLKRFAPVLSIYYDPAQEPHLLEILTQHLPLSHHKRTLVDSFMHRIHF